MSQLHIRRKKQIIPKEINPKYVKHPQNLRAPLVDTYDSDVFSQHLSPQTIQLMRSLQSSQIPQISQSQSYHATTTSSKYSSKYNHKQNHNRYQDIDND